MPSVSEPAVSTADLTTVGEKCAIGDVTGVQSNGRKSANMQNQINELQHVEDNSKRTNRPNDVRSAVDHSNTSHTNGAGDRIRIAVVGGGISGLGTAIALLRVPGVTVDVYEKATELREIGGGLSIGPHTRRVLEKLGVEHDFVGQNMHPFHHFKGINGELLHTQEALSTHPYEQHVRVRRTDLHNALLAAIPKERMHLSSTLESIREEKPNSSREIHGQKMFKNSKVVLDFKGRKSESFDLVIGADGIRSKVRDFAFPDAPIQWNGIIAYRAIIPMSALEGVSAWDPTKTTAWYLPGLFIFYTVFHNWSTDEDRCEVVLRTVHKPDSMTAEEKEKLDPIVSWGVDISNEIVEGLFKDFDQNVQHLLKCVPQGGWKKYAAFAGRHLDTTVANGNVALVGDAGHPMSGAFGSGATFGLEDGWALGTALARMKNLGSQEPIEDALKAFDIMRTPYYHKLYRYLDDLRAMNMQAIKETGWEAAWTNTATWFYSKRLNWIYFNSLDQELDEAIAQLELEA